MYAVVEKRLVAVAVAVPRKAALQSREFFYGVVELLFYIVVELLRTRLGVYYHKCVVNIIAVHVKCVLYELEVGRFVHVLLLKGVCVEANKEGSAGLEREVEAAEYLLIGAFACANHVVVAYYAYIGHFQPLHNIALPHELVGCAKIGQVAAVDDERYFAVAVYRTHGVVEVVIPSLGVADYSKAQGVAVLLCFNLFNVLERQAGLALNLAVVGMVSEHVAAAQN